MLTDGHFQVELYYTCPETELASIIELTYENSKISKKIIVPFDPPLIGKENDRIPRMESYVKEYNKLNLGVLVLTNGKGKLTLKALKIPGSQVADFRLLQFKRIK